MEVQKNIPLAGLTWWQMGGPADYFAQPATIEQLKEILARAHREKWPVTILGGGTNVLISDRGVEGLVIHLSRLTGCQARAADGRLHIEALAGTPKSELTKIFLREKLLPALFLCGLPGDVGGGVVMNAGVSEHITPREFVELVEQVDVVGLDGVAQTTFQRDQLQWLYRKTIGWQPGVIAQVRLSWPLEPDPTLMRRVKEATKSRLSRQPLEYPSCGSVFQNPPGDAAGRLIEQAGLKGYAMGGVEVSEKHANFIVNKLKTGKAVEARALIEHIQKTVRHKFGIDLHPEVQFLGRW